MFRDTCIHHKHRYLCSEDMSALQAQVRIDRQEVRIFNEKVRAIRREERIFLMQDCNFDVKLPLERKSDNFSNIPLGGM